MSQHVFKKTDVAPSAGRCRYWGHLFVVLLSVYTAAHAQDRKFKLEAELLESIMINGELCTRLTDNVVVGLEKCTIKADCAVYYKDRKLIEAQGHIDIMYEDGAAITAEQLLYDGVNHLAKLRGNVIYKSDDIIFYTDHLDYNTETKQGYFLAGGRLVEGDNVLMSVSGQYNNLDKTATFDQEVVLTNRGYILQCDRLCYNTATKLAQFAGFTKITSKDGKHTLTTHEQGEYNTSSQQSTFAQSKVETEAYTLYGDLFRADLAAEIYTVTGHIKLIAKEDDVIIVGDYGQYREKEGTAEIYGNALMTKVLEDDMLYLSADTFMATGNRSTDGRHDIKVRACHNVKLCKEDFQGKADSMIYEGEEATIYFHGEPIFWSYKSQFTADSTYIILEGKMFLEMHMDTNALVLSEGAAGNYNQLRGSNMVAFFKKNKIDSVEVAGNAESIYFVADDNRQLEGMHHIRCGQISMLIKDDTIADITFKTNPVGVFYPPQEITEEARKLDTFRWRSGERPTKQEIIKHGYRTQKAYKKFKLNQKH